MRHDDPELLRRCLAGEQAAWDALIDRYSRLVYSVPRRYGLSDADAADVHQNVFIAAYRKLGSLKDHTRLSSWLITTAHRESWRIGRRGEAAGELDRIIADVGHPSAEQAARWERQHMVRQALEELGGQCRDLLTALFLEAGESSYESIAHRLGMRPGSIGPTRARCFGKLEAILLRIGFEPEELLEEPGEEAGSRSARAGQRP